MTKQTVEWVMVYSLLKALTVMECFTQERPRMSLGEVAAATQLNKTTVYNILATLASRGYVVRVGEDYALGNAILHVTQGVLDNVEIRDRAAPILRQLADEVSESIYLVVPDGDRVLYIYAIESSHRLQARSVLGDRAYYHSTAIGKAALAFSPPERQEAVLAVAALPARTANTITKPQRMREELQLIRERGYATDCEENEAKTFCLAAPVFGASGNLVAACSISGDTIAILEERRDGLTRKLLHAAMQVSQHMGHVPTRSQLVMLKTL